MASTRRMLATTLTAVAAIGAASLTVPAFAAQLEPAKAAFKAPTANIVGGTAATEGVYPWAARMRTPAPAPQTGFYTCGATLLSPDILLTAQHCLSDKPDHIEAFIGHVDWKQSQTEGLLYTGTKYKVGPGPKMGDWAVVKLDKAVPQTNFPLLPVDASNDATGTYKAIGWGLTSSTAPKSEQFLREVNLPAVTESRCGSYTKVELCAGDWDKGGVDTCQGDSGGPLLKQINGNWVQLGVTSWGIGCGKKALPGHYAKVSAFLKEIKAAIAELGGKPARTIADGPAPAPTTPAPTTSSPTPGTPSPTPTIPVPSPSTPDTRPSNVPSTPPADPTRPADGPGPDRTDEPTSPPIF